MLISTAPQSSFPMTLFIPDDVLFALNQRKETFEREARLLLSIKYYETGKLTSGLAAKMAGVSRSDFFRILSQHGLSPFGVDADELEDDLANATLASHIE